MSRSVCDGCMRVGVKNCLACIEEGGTREVAEPEIVVEVMPWKCVDCGHKWPDRMDGHGVAKRGCPACGSTRVIDCNVSVCGRHGPVYGIPFKGREAVVEEVS